MKKFLFYDLETSGLNPLTDRIMQFAGVETDTDLQPTGRQFNLLVKLTDDILPSPEAILTTGITPQKTIEEGYSEPEFAKLLMTEIFLPDTIIVGYNNIRFDDRFIQNLLWRNFYDPYEWSWSQGRSRWDLLDVIRMTRALRPEGIEWPFTETGEPTNTLELLSQQNKILQRQAHDALSDVEALIGLARLIRTKQPQLFNYLLKMRDKKPIKELVNLDHKVPFVYSSGRLDSEFLKTTVAFPLTTAPNNNLVVYDLRYDPTPYLDLKPAEIQEILFGQRETPFEERQKLPVKEFQYNHAPAIAPLSVLSQQAGWEKIKLTEQEINKHLGNLLKRPDFAENVRTAYENRPVHASSSNAEERLYEGFITDIDKKYIKKISGMDATQLADLQPTFVDERLDQLLFFYKAHHYPESLTKTEASTWSQLRSQRLEQTLPEYLKSLQTLASQPSLTSQQTFLLEELQLWAESLLH